MKFLPVLLAALVISVASAQDKMGVSAYPDRLDGEIVAEPLVPSEFYVVLVEPTHPIIGGYECSLSLTDPDPLILTASGPNNWLNFGTFLNHLVGYGTPLVAGDVTILATIRFFVIEAPTLANIVMGPAQPSSFDDAGPGYADGVDPRQLVLCDYTVPGGQVGTIVADVVPVVGKTFSGVKDLFR